MPETKLARKITATLFAMQSLASAALIVTATVNAIAGAQLSGKPALAGVPSAIIQLGTAFAALVVGGLMDRLGRRGALSLGMLLGIIGSGVAMSAIIAVNFLAFLAGLALLGFARAAMQLGRFAAAEVHPPESRGRAISYVVIGGTVGSVLGPLLIGPAGDWATAAALDELAGPYALGMVILALTALVLFLFLRPDPRDLGRQITALHPETVTHPGPARSLPQIFRTPAAFVALTAMVFGQVVMVMLMGMTSLYMKQNQHALTNISLVFSAHTLGMFAFSILTGRLTDHWGRGPVILVGAGMLVVSGLLAPLSPDVLPLSLSLFLLGLGWNFCYVGGSALLSDQLSPAERAKTQGANDLMIGLATAGGSFVSGLIFAAAGYGAVALTGLVAALLPLGLAGWWMRRRQLLGVV